MNEWLAVAPQAQVAHGMTGCMVSLNDMADRAPRVLADGEVIDLGGRRVRYIDTPHVPHGWEPACCSRRRRRTLLCGDLFTHTGNGPALTEGDIVGPAIAAEDISSTPRSVPRPRPPSAGSPTWPPAHWRSCTARLSTGDAAAALRSLAGAYDERLRRATG